MYSKYFGTEFFQTRELAVLSVCFIFFFISFLLQPDCNWFLWAQKFILSYAATLPCTYKGDVPINIKEKCKHIPKAFLNTKQFFLYLCKCLKNCDWELTTIFKDSNTVFKALAVFKTWWYDHSSDQKYF